jgi:hypothetical protein
MKMITARRISWIVLTLALTFGAIAANPANAQKKPAAKTTKVKTDKPKPKTVYGTFSQANATGVKIKSDKEEMSANLVPTTVYWRTQKSVPSADLKVGETVKMNLPGTDDMGRVESVSPLTLKFGDNVTLVYDKPGKMRFVRISKIAATDVVVGQKGKVAASVYPDGRVEAREVWVETEPEKAPKKTTVTKKE